MTTIVSSADTTQMIRSIVFTLTLIRSYQDSFLAFTAWEKNPSSFSFFSRFFSCSSSVELLFLIHKPYFFAIYLRMSRETASTITRPCTT